MAVMSISRRELVRDVVIGAAGFVASRNLVFDALAAQPRPFSCIERSKKRGDFGVVIQQHVDPLAFKSDALTRSLQAGEHTYEEEKDETIRGIKKEIEERHGIKIVSPKTWEDGSGNVLENMRWELPEWKLLQEASQTLPRNYEFTDNFEVWLAKLAGTNAPGGGGATYPDERIELYISEQFAQEKEFIEGSIEHDLFPNEGEQLKSAFHHEVTHQQMFTDLGRPCYKDRFYSRFWKRDQTDPRDVAFQLKNPVHAIPFANADRLPWEHFAVAMSLIPYWFKKASILHPDIVNFFRTDPFFAEWFKEMSFHAYLPRVVEGHK